MGHTEDKMLAFYFDFNDPVITNTTVHRVQGDKKNKDGDKTQATRIQLATSYLISSLL